MGVRGWPVGERYIASRQGEPPGAVQGTGGVYLESTLPLAVDRLASLDSPERDRLVRRAGAGPEGVTPVVEEIIRNVRERGDAALREYTERFDGVRLDSLEVTDGEFEDAMRAIDRGVLRALQVAMDNIQRFHLTQLQPQPVVETMPGVRVWREWRPVERVGLYAPGGRAVYPSSVLMNAVAARVAGCGQVVICAPPDKRGLIPAPTLVAASLAGVTRFFKVGGAQAIAAMAYGTETVPSMLKLFGAGNAYVTAAKMRVYGDVDIDMPAGPSEILVIADGTADAAYVASDLLAQSEHGPDSASILVTTSVDLAERVATGVASQLDSLPHWERIEQSLRSYGRILLVDSLGEAAAFSNEYAPEHLAIVTAEPEALLPLISNAGSIFLGEYAPVAAGDYATGASHVIPTGGRAKTTGPLSVESFGRWVQVQAVSRDGLLGLREAIVALAEAEGLEAHARSVDIRYER